MGLPVWITGLIIGAIFVVVGISFDEATTDSSIIKRVSDTMLIFGVIIVIISIAVIVVPVVRGR